MHPTTEAWAEKASRLEWPPHWVNRHRWSQRAPSGMQRGKLLALGSCRGGCYLGICVSSCEMLSGSCCPVLRCYSICFSLQWPSCLHPLFDLPAVKWRKHLLSSASYIYLLSSHLHTLSFLNWAVFSLQNHHYITAVPSFSVSLTRVQTGKSPNPNVLFLGP